MVQRRGAWGDSLEASERWPMIRPLIQQELEGHRANEWVLPGLADDPYPAVDLLENAVPRDSLPSHWKGSRPARPSYVSSYGKSMDWRSGGLAIRRVTAIRRPRSQRRKRYATLFSEPSERRSS